MVNNLNELADFLDMDSLPPWLKEKLKEKRDDIFRTLQNGQEFTIRGPQGQEVKIAPKHAA